MLFRSCADPGGFTAGRHDALRALMDGLLFAGLAMQMVGTSRPASGAEAEANAGVSKSQCAQAGESKKYYE